MDYSVLNVEMDRTGANWEVNITLQVRLLKISYTWNSFFSQGLLSAYHTCGQNLPLAIFKVPPLQLLQIVRTRSPIGFFRFSRGTTRTTSRRPSIRGAGSSSTWGSGSPWIRCCPSAPTCTP